MGRYVSHDVNAKTLEEVFGGAPWPGRVADRLTTIVTLLRAALDAGDVEDAKGLTNNLDKIRAACAAANDTTPGRANGGR